MSALVEACRHLFGNVPPGRLAPEGWPLRHPILATLLWIGLILVIFIPLAVRRYTKAVSR